MTSAKSSIGATNPDRPVPLVDAIREAIIEGEFAANQRLIESDLSERFGASRGNVRTALLQLTSEGLVERMLNRGARVRAVSLAEAIEITEVRMALEGLCAAKAAERPAPAPPARRRRRSRRCPRWRASASPGRRRSGRSSDG